jgi:hypothetical protein
MPTPEEKREFLLKDFSEISNLRNNYANMRLVALGTVLTLMSAIVAFGKGTQYPDVLGIYAVLLLMVFTGVRIISAINRGLYVFVDYLQWIEEELGVIGFTSQWNRYLRFNQSDSGSYAFVVATRAMNFVTSVYVITDSGLLISQGKMIAVIAVLAAITLFMWNELHIRNQLNPKGFVRRINSEWIKARKLCLEERNLDEKTTM